MNGKAILWSSWLAGIYCWCWRRVGCLLLVSYQDMGGSCSSDLSCYQTDRYESSSLQGSADTSPGLQPCVLMPVIFEWTRRGYRESLPLPLIDYWPASPGSSVVVQFVCIRRGIPLQIVCNVWMWAVQTDSLGSLCVLLCWCRSKRPPWGIISHSLSPWGRDFTTLQPQEPVISLPLRGLYKKLPLKYQYKWSVEDKLWGICSVGNSHN